MTKKQAIPPMRRREENLDERPTLVATGYEVCSWSPGRAGENVPSTEVHLLITFGALRAGLGLKSARALDELVGVLLAHRKDVWGAEGS